MPTTAFGARCLIFFVAKILYLARSDGAPVNPIQQADYHRSLSGSRVSASGSFRGAGHIRVHISIGSSGGATMPVWQGEPRDRTVVRLGLAE
jgi:hypothetical protein